MTPLAPGHLLGERFRLVRPFGKGGMGDVWLAEDLELSDRVVVKLVPPNANASVSPNVSPNVNDNELALLRQECRHARKLSHPNIVPVFEFHRLSGRSFITMEHVEGTHISGLQGQPVAKVLDALILIADALAYAHGEGVVHRDLKASNVLVDTSGAPKLVDFGISGRVGTRDDNAQIQGGGSEGAASPQQRAGYPPSEADDIYAFGVLARDLLSGQRLPATLEALLIATMNREPEHRPRSMDEVKNALEASRGELVVRPQESASPTASPVLDGKDITLIPPPRPARVEPIAPAAARTSAPTSVPFGRRNEPGGVGGKTIAAFIILISLALGVFLILPRWVEQTRTAATAGQSRDTSDPSGSETTPAPNEDAVPELEALAQEMAPAESLRQRAVDLRDSLEARNAGAWGGDAYRDGIADMVRGDEQMGRRAFAEAQASFQNALGRFESVGDNASRVANEALQRGRDALVAGSATEAEDAFNLAGSIRPGDAQAARGLARAKVVDELRRLLAQGAALLSLGELESAADAYRTAARLDPLSTQAQQGLARVDAEASEKAFTRAMSDAVAAMNRKDFEAARAGFERARAIRPEATGVADGLKAVDDAQRLQTIATHRARAGQLEQQEAWREAAQHYQSVLDIDDTIRFAREGKTRSSARAALSDKLEFHIDNPERLSEDRVLEEASRTLDDARAVTLGGPRLQSQVTRLANLVSEFSTPVQVRLLSDGHTEVVVFKIGAIGKFDSHALVLRPGTYTVVGRRQGYRDVRHKLVVQADVAPEPLMVRCVEEI